MKKHLLLAACIPLLFVACRKKNDGGGTPIPQNKALIWDKKFGGNEYDFMSTSVQLPNGDFIVAGNTRSTDGDVVSPPRAGYDFWYARVGANGEKIWSKTYGTNADEYNMAAQMSNDGNIVIAGYAFNNWTNTAMLSKISPSGDLIWSKAISPNPDAKPWAMISTDDGGFVIAGVEKSAGGSLDGWVSKVNSNGDVVWSRAFGGSADDQFTGIVKTSDGFALSGFIKSQTNDLGQNRGGNDGWVVKINESGALLWSKTFGGPDADVFKSIVQGTDGSLYAIGHSRSRGGDIPNARGGDDAWIMKISQSGAPAWSKNYGGLNEEYITTAVPTNDGGIFFAGYSNSNTFDVPRPLNDFGIWLMKLDGNGNKGVTSIYGGDRGDEVVNNIRSTSDGGFIVTGYQDVPGRGYDGLVIKIGPL